MLPCYAKVRKLEALGIAEVVGSSSPRQVVEISVSFTYTEDHCIQFKMDAVSFRRGNLWFLEGKHRFSIQ